MAPKNMRTQHAPPSSKTLILDNGGYSIKAGVINEGSADIPTPRIISNAISRNSSRHTYIGSQLSSCTDFSELALRRPVEKGLVVNWELQRAIWEREFLDSDADPATRVDPSETRLLLSEPANGLPVLSAQADQMVFEEFGFASYFRGPAANWNTWIPDLQRNVFKTSGLPTDHASAVPAKVMLLVDSGYSSTTVMPLLDGRPIHSAVRRLDVGGKLLTNQLTRLLSLRHYDMRSDPWIVNEIKEAACFVSRDFSADLDACWKGAKGEKRSIYSAGSGGIAREYLLPDFHAVPRGYVRPFDPAAHTGRNRRLASATNATNEDVLILRNERFTVPELLFNPSDVGVRQPGLSHMIMQSIRKLPIGLWPGLLANVLCVGGTAQLDGFVPRLQDELEAIAPDQCVVRVAKPDDAFTSSWYGGANMVRMGAMESREVTKAEYEEHGGAWAARRFTGQGDKD